MSVFVIRGDAWPKGDTVSSPGLTFVWADDAGNPVKMLFEMKDSEITMTCNAAINRSEVGAFGTMVTMSAFFGQSVLDTFGFMTGNAFTIVIHSVIYEGGEETKLRIHEPAVIGLCTALSPETFSHAMPFVISHPLLTLALNDLHTAISIPAQTFVCCGRAIDCVRKIVAGENVAAEEGWKITRKQLNISRPYIQMVMNESKDPRHGSRAKGGAIQTDMKVRAWTVVNRAILYVQRSRIPLTDPEFSEL